MKFLKYIVAVVLLSATLVACMPPELNADENSLPSVDIVERSRLLDTVTVDHIISEKDRQILKDFNISAEMSDFCLIADDIAQFKLNFITESGRKYGYTAKADIDYNMPREDTFTDIRFYWGSILKAGGEMLVTFSDSAVLIPADGAEDTISFDLSFVKEKGGHIVHTARGFGKFAFFYYTPREAGLAVFDSNGQLIAEKSEEIRGEASVNMLNTHSELLVSDVPFSYIDEFDGWFVNENLLLIDHGWVYEGSDIEEYRLYNCAENTVSYSAHRYADDITVDDTTYSVLEIYVPDGGDINVGYQGLALKKQDGLYTGAVLYDTKGFNYVKQAGGKLYLEDNGNLVYHSQPTGLRFTINFENSTCEKNYLITEDMLGEKLATSKDKKYSIYEYGKYLNKNWYVSWRAVKNEKTGEIKYFDGYYAKNYTDISLEAGFFSNGEIYLMHDFDFEIFDPVNPEKGPILSIGKKYPLGIKNDEGRPVNTLWAVRRDPVDKTFIVVNDHLGPHRWYLTDEMFDGVYFKDTFDVSLLDKEGNIVKTFTTDMKVPRDTNILNISISGDMLTMTNISDETGEIMQKATLNINTGKFTMLTK